MADPPAHTLELRLVVSAGDEEGREFRDTYSASHAVYSRYQVAVHGDAPHKVDAKQHRRFLVDSPLQEEAGRGSYHQQYWLDGRLIAVGVLDLLPRYVSSVYLYYDPDYSFLSLGTYAALREVALTRQLMREDPRMRYYGMGFYIQSCPKMRYKGNVRPAQLLCPQAYTWNPLAASVPKLDANKYSRLDDSDCEDAHGQVALASVGVLYKRTAMRYATYAVYSGGATDASEVSEYARLVGRPCAASMLLYRSDAAATRGSHDEEDDDSSDD
ncbi:PREDICTED: arginyl-tRNA--protein transferase 1-like isoform X2 [Priapulus caudatus]|uniref:Arginyl-tRNA--protein transferase 1-like isoform X2 n=1 Tax=Priapulus caudatus TaxID=37621 RepID=A0ABM1F4R4_PRICU|nr:PREDICTED: arginyl-tRNA--protein transferase 1-like isoform X2 [Priapulus caudatus]